MGPARRLLCKTHLSPHWSLAVTWAAGAKWILRLWVFFFFLMCFILLDMSFAQRLPSRPGPLCCQACPGMCSSLDQLSRKCGLHLLLAVCCSKVARLWWHACLTAHAGLEMWGWVCGERRGRALGLSWTTLKHRCWADRCSGSSKGSSCLRGCVRRWVWAVLEVSTLACP